MKACRAHNVDGTWPRVVLPLPRRAQPVPLAALVQVGRAPGVLLLPPPAERVEEGPAAWREAEGGRGAGEVRQ